jgi:hypothetical protein
LRSKWATAATGALANLVSLIVVSLSSSADPGEWGWFFIFISSIYYIVLLIALEFFALWHLGEISSIFHRTTCFIQRLIKRNPAFAPGFLFQAAWICSGDRNARRLRGRYSIMGIMRSISHGFKYR